MLLHRLALFGSWARGDQTPSSDVDILVEVAPSIGLRFVTLVQRSEALWGLRSILSHGAQSNQPLGRILIRILLMSRRIKKLVLNNNF